MMQNAQLICHSGRRRRKVREEKRYGLDYLELCDDRRTLCVYFLGKAPPWLKPKKEDEAAKPEPKPEPKPKGKPKVTEPPEVTEIELPLAQVHIEGGRRITDLEVIEVRLFRFTDPDTDDLMKVTLRCPGDFSTYTLSLVRLEGGKPVATTDMDPRFDSVSFNFNIEDQPSDLDCKQAVVCPPKSYAVPEIDYLAKDYASFRQLILDRLAVIMPDWKERHVPDIGITLVELLAYVGDHLSYYQDGVATEAYLDTARQRISVHRHARLVDYHMHEGCNARAWVFIETNAPQWTLRPRGISFITGLNDLLPLKGRVLTWADLENIPRSQYEVFEPLVENPDAELNFYQAHNKIEIYTWGNKECCLPVGTTRVALKDGPARQAPPSQPEGKPAPSEQQPNVQAVQAAEDGYQRILDHLKEKDVLILQEVLGPKTGLKADADPAHRHVVRLTKLERTVDELYDQPLVEVAWAEEDALPFPLCISALGPAPKCELLEPISIARGNVVLVDHGLRIEDGPDAACKQCWCVPTQSTAAECEGEGRPTDVILRPGRFRPSLKETPLTFSQPPQFDAPASAMLTQDPRQAVPWIQLTSVPDPDCLPAQEQGEPAAPPVSPEAGKPGDETSKSQAAQPEQAAPPAQPEATSDAAQAASVVPGSVDWKAQPDLLNSRADDAHFVAEIDNGGRAHLRFGDGELGRQPEAGTRFKAVYRVGNGLAGNVGAEAITHVVSDRWESGINVQPWNPLPASGGMAPEPMEDVKLFAPHAFRRRLERAITADDYAEIVLRDFSLKVQRAAATLRWTGSWYEVLVAVDQRGREEAEPSLLAEIGDHLRRYRRIGHDVAVESAQLVPLYVKMEVCVKPGYLSGHVKAALLDRFGNRTLPDGKRGFFHPDELTFGEGIYLSKLVAAAQAVVGMENAVVKKLERLYEGPNGELEAGLLRLGPLEVAQLDNDPNFPEHGRFELIMRGGR
jgi:hypothetical protein